MHAGNGHRRRKKFYAAGYSALKKLEELWEKAEFAALQVIG